MMLHTPTVGNSAAPYTWPACRLEHGLYVIATGALAWLWTAARGRATEPPEGTPVYHQIRCTLCGAEWYE